MPKDYNTPALLITSAVDGFRRAGVAHSAKPTNHPVGLFSPEQVYHLKSEPKLVVTEVRADNSKPVTGRPNAADTIKLVNAAETVEALDELAKDEARGTVQAAIEARRAALAADQQ